MTDHGKSDVSKLKDDPMNNAVELKPCPFCGGKAELWRAHADRPAWIACGGECVVLVTRECKTDDEAAAIWNRRTETAP